MAVALGPDAAPWLCVECARGFFTAELSDDARSRYRPRFHDWGQGTPAIPVSHAVDEEVAEAHLRGSSLRLDQVHLVHVGALRGLVGAVTLGDELVEAVANELLSRGV